MAEISLAELLQQAYQWHIQGEAQKARQAYETILKAKPEHLESRFLMGRLNYEENRYAESASFLEGLKDTPVAPQEYYPYLGPCLQMLERHAEAEAIYLKLLEWQPQEAGTLYNLGAVLQAQERFAEAENYYQQALQQRPQYPKAHNNLGACLVAQNKIVEALEHFRQATDQAPGYRLAWLNLAQSSVKQDPHEAIAAYLQVLKLEDSAQIHFELGRVYQNLGQLDFALASFQAALKQDNGHIDSWRNLAVTQQALGNWEDSVLSLKKALQIQAEHPACLWDLSNAYKELGQSEQAQQHLKKLVEAAPTVANRIREFSFVPPLYHSHQELQACRQRIEKALADFEPQKIEDPLSEIGQSNFYLAYQGGNDRPLQEAFAQLYRGALPSEIAPTTARPQDSRLRVGFVSGFLYNHTISHYYRKHIEMLDPERVQVELFFSPASLEDHVTRELCEEVSAHWRLPRDLKAAAQIVANRHLDVLVYLDIGMEPFTYFLAFTRLAPVQCVLPGHPVTTGIPTMDYYVSNTWMERPDADVDYSETLVQLDSLPVWYTRPKLPKLKSKRALGLSKKKHLYLCPMTLFKIHPDMDAALLEILEQDPQAEIGFFQFKTTRLHEILEQRFAHSLGKQAERVRFFPWASPQNYFSLLNEAEVLLDSLHFGGGSTHFLCFAVGTPLITWPSPYLRGRSGAGMYRRMGLDDAVVKNRSEYANQAIALACDKDARKQLKKQILKQNSVLFDNPEGPQAFAQWIFRLNPQHR